MSSLIQNKFFFPGNYSVGREAQSNKSLRSTRIFAFGTNLFEITLATSVESADHSAPQWFALELVNYTKRWWFSRNWIR